MRVNGIILLFSINFSVVFSRTWDILWERNYCNSTLPNGFVYPFTTDCSLCISDQLRLYTPNPENYENIYRVQTEQEMLSCDATNALNSFPTVFNSETVFTLINSGASDGAFNFYLGENIYLISTSNGTESSAGNDVFRQGPCLQFSFVLLTSSQDCGNFDSCEMKNIFTDGINEIGCNLHNEPIESRNLTQSTVSPTHSSTTTTNLTETTIFPDIFNGVFRNYVVYIAISLSISLIGITVGVLSLVLLRRLFYRRKQILQVEHQLENENNHFVQKKTTEFEEEWRIIKK